MLKKVLWRTTLAGLGLIAGGTAYLGYRLLASLPTLDGAANIAGLSAPVEVTFDRLGIPQIEANTRADAYRALGFVTARDRLFQMDLLRRHSAGRLAEILGPDLLESDRWHRSMSFEPLAHKILMSLPNDQQDQLRAYADGVNSALSATEEWPIEFQVLDYEPLPWTAEDSLLVVLGLYETLSGRGDDERSVTVMKAALPPEVLSFLMPDTDCYTERVVEASQSDCGLKPMPVDELKKLFKANDETGSRGLAGLVRTQTVPRGSNAWVVASAKSREGRALLANDMHLQLNVPNIWYRAEIRYDNTRLAGITLPGLPLLVVGTNYHVAWGLTAIAGVDVIDLVLLDMDSTDNMYRTPQGLEKMIERQERIKVRGGAEEIITIKETVWGPVLAESLLGRPVAVRWTALDPSATNLALGYLDRAASVPEALDVINVAGGPPLNALVVDEAGSIGWTQSGRIPLRSGFDGYVAQSSGDGMRQWKSYIAPDDLPRVINPPSGFLVNANQRMSGAEYRYVIGHNFGGGYRAHRITERLRAMQAVTERDMLDIQLDTQTDFYRFYQRVALQALSAKGVEDREDLAAIHKYLEAWNGRADKESLGLPLLLMFRDVLADAVFAPLLVQCRALDPKFEYSWATIDVPLQQLVGARLPELMPDRQSYADWNAFLVAMLENSVHLLLNEYHIASLYDLTWGQVNVTEISHPLGGAVPFIGRLLNMPREPVSGCDQCVRVAGGSGGATERLVTSAKHPDEGILHMPGGQSGHPLSPFYRDQHAAWIEGRPTAFLAGETQHRLRLEPADVDPPNGLTLGGAPE